MKFSFRKKEVLPALSKIQPISARPTQISITSEILIKAEGEKITLTANNLETIFVGSYDAQVEKDGTLSINAKKFFEIVREYPGDEIMVNEVKKRWIEIGTGDSVYHIASSNVENFPEPPEIDNVNFFGINSRSFRQMLDVAIAVNVSGDEKRPYVLAALFEKIINEDKEGYKIRIVSTDSRRMNLCDIDFIGQTDFLDESVMIPKKGLSELGKFVSDDDFFVNIGVEKNHFVFKDENETIMVNLLVGEYPNYKAVMKIDDVKPISIDRKKFIGMMKRASILTSDEYKSVKLHLTDFEISALVNNPEIGESKETMVIKFDAEEIKLTLNPKFLLDALNIFCSENIDLSVKDSKSPCKISSPDEKNLTCVIMLMADSASPKAK